MTLGTTPSPGQGTEPHGPRPSEELLPFLKDHISKTEEFRSSLKAEYDKVFYEEFEMRFNDLRYNFNKKLADISNPDNEYLNHSDLRKKAVEQILEDATRVAQRFQEARKNNELDRPACMAALEKLIISITNLKTLVEGAGGS